MLVLILTLGLISAAISIFIPGKSLIVLEPYFIVTLTYTQLSLALTGFFVALNLLWKFINFVFFRPLRWYDSFKRKREVSAINEAFQAYAKYLGGVSDSVKEYSKSSKILSDNPLYWALSLNFSNRYPITQQALDELKHYKIGGFFEIYYKVMDFIENEQYDRALLILENAPDYTKKMPWYWLSSFSCYLQEENIDKAKAALKSYHSFGLKTNSMEAELYYLQARTEKTSKNKLAYFEKAYESDRHNENLIHDYASALHAYNESSKAIKVITNSWHMQNTLNLGLLLEKILTATKTDSERFQTLKELVENNPDDSISQLLLARSALQAGMWFIARDTLMHIAETKPLLAFPLLAELELREKQDKDAAYKWLSKLSSYIQSA